MISRNPNVILFDSAGNPLAIEYEGDIDLTTKGICVGGHADGLNKFEFLHFDDQEQLKVTLSEDNSNPITVILSQGTRSYYHVDLTNNASPATVTSVTGPFNVGGTSLTINVNAAGDQVVPFATRAATEAYHISGPNPATSNPDVEKIKVGINGGALIEVKTGKGLASGAAIAASLQTQIRALVPNGSAATVQFDTPAYPLRYLIKSGITGNAATIDVQKGGDNLAIVLKLNGYGGTSYNGTDANTYRAFEVVNTIAAGLANVTVAEEAIRKVKITTVLGGASASLQVTAGGANTALQYPTAIQYGTAGSGSVEMNVDGSVIALRYGLIIPAGKTFVVSQVVFRIRDDATELKTFGGLLELTNGVKFEVKNEYLPLIAVTTAKTNADLITRAEDGQLIADAFAAGGKDLVKAVFDFGAGLRIPSGSDANVYVTIQDNLTGLNSFTVRAKGWIE